MTHFAPFRMALFSCIVLLLLMSLSAHSQTIEAKKYAISSFGLATKF